MGGGRRGMRDNGFESGRGGAEGFEMMSMGTGDDDY